MWFVIKYNFLSEFLGLYLEFLQIYMLCYCCSLDLLFFAVLTNIYRIVATTDPKKD